MDTGRHNPRIMRGTMLPVYLDYETFSECDLRSAGLWAYARHPSTRILCVAWAVGDAKPRLWWPGKKLPQELVSAFRHAKLRAFNANFELAITECVASKLGFPVPKLEQWEDTQAIARMCAYPGSLDKVSRALKLRELKNQDGHRLIRFFCIPQRDGSVNMPKDHPGEFNSLCHYCAQDVIVDREVHHALPVQQLPPFEQKVWREDCIVNRRGVPVDVALAKGAWKMAGAAKATGAEALARETGGVITSPGQSQRIIKLAASLGFPLENLKKDTVATALDNGEMPAMLRNVLELRAGVNLTSVAKYNAMLKAVEPDGRIRGVHAYHAADTGRWGGRIVQFQNLPRPHYKFDNTDHALIRKADYDGLYAIYGNLMPVLRDALRNVIRAEKGHELHVVDKASIEARVLGWLADDEQYMKAYRANEDLYILTAMAIFDKKRSFFEKDSKGQMSEAADFMRWVGKGCVLGLGYGMGWKTFLETCRKNGRAVPVELIKKAVAMYRKLYFRIPLYWRTVEQACHKAIKLKTTVRLPHGVSTHYDGRNMTIGLPSGRCLWYPDARLKMVTKFDRDQYEIHFSTVRGNAWATGTTYGGRLVENIVQAVARDLLAEALIKCEAAGLRPVMHVHDEIVCEPKLGRSIDEMHTIFRTAPPWAKGLPLGSGGFVSPFYKK